VISYFVDVRCPGTVGGRFSFHSELFIIVSTV